MPGRFSPVTWVATIALLAGVAALLAGALGAFGITTTTTQDGPTAELPLDGSGGPFVLSKHDAPPGFTFLGIEFGDHTYTAGVGFVAPEGCHPTDGEPFEAAGACAGVPVAGIAAGGGTLPAGESFVVVDVEITDTCFAAIQPGEHWPSAREECSG